MCEAKGDACLQSIKVAKWQSGKAPTACANNTPPSIAREPSATPSGTNRAVRAVHRQGDASGCCTERRGRGRVPPGGGSNQVEAAHPGSRALTSSEVTCTPQESLRARKRGRATDAGAWLGGQWGLFALVMRRDWGVPLARATAGRCSSVPQRQSWGARTQRTPSPFALEQAL